MADRAARKVLEAWTERLEGVSKEQSLAWWAVNTDASPENSKRLAAALKAYEEACHDPEGFARVTRCLAEGVEDATLRRSLEVLRDELTPYQAPADVRMKMVDLEASIQQRYSSTRGRVGGVAKSDNELVEILKTSTDSALREEAWRASKEVGQAVAADVRTLVRLRNEAARALGYPDHYQMALSLQQVDPAWLDTFLSRMAAATERPFAAYKAALDRRLASRFSIHPEDLRPWHYEDPFFQEAPQSGKTSFDALFKDRDLVTLTRRTYDALGLDIDPVLERSDLTPRPGKCQHAFCMHVDRKGDVRVLCNNVPDERWAGTMLHEFGHAVYDRYIDLSLPFVLRAPPHMSSTEAIAMLFGRLSKDPAWLVPVLGLSEKDAQSVADAASAAFRDGMLVFVRWVLVMTRFERAMYADPERDLDGLWWDLVERFQGVRRPPGRKAPDWAAKIHIATAPVYYHSYLMGECIASQLSRHIRTKTGGALVDNPAAGAFLKDSFFAPGATQSWNDHLASATGSPLDPTIFLEEVGIAPVAAAR
jgi:peptidyl-dipeptidase A